MGVFVLEQAQNEGATDVAREGSETGVVGARGVSREGPIVCRWRSKDDLMNETNKSVHRSASEGPV